MQPEQLIKTSSAISSTWLLNKNVDTDLNVIENARNALWRIEFHKVE